MSTRAYDYKLTLSDATNFTKGNTVIGLTSNTVAEIIDVSSTELKVKLANSFQEFIVGESAVSNVALLVSYNAFINHSANITGSTNVFALPLTYNNINLIDSINVYVDDVIAPRDSYIINSNNTIQFLPLETLSITTSNTLTIFSDIRQTTIFPTVNTSSLYIQVVSGNVNADSFISANFEGTILSASSEILEINDSPYIAEKNAINQSPIVKLYTIYYPGEWYPPNNFDNPSGSGEGFPWPAGFPIRYAEILSNDYYQSSYDVLYGGVSYVAEAIESDNIQISSLGSIGEITLTISNFDGSIASIVDNKNILGYNSTNSASAHINGELVQNIDPRTILGNALYDANVTAIKGSNAVWNYSDTINNGDTWTSFRSDSRDLSGAIVEIQLTYAKFLDYWPEYSIVKTSTANSANVYSSSVYRVGDLVTTQINSNTTVITDIVGDTLLFVNSNLSSLSANTKIFIVNPDADSSAHIKHVFTLNSLDELDELTAKFNLTSWLQYFKQNVPKRKFYSTSCPFTYKGKECKYPSNGTGTIVGSNPKIEANGFFTVSNVSTANIEQDICSKTLTACKLRKNLVNFGGFPNAQ
jgi:lambda family phage minor tail protein L